jgi:hydrogenase nickel incorporation protein HypB
MNSQCARAGRAALDGAGVTAISLVGPAGSGKTSIIESVLARLNPRVRAAVIVGNLAADRQAERLARRGHQAIPIVTENLTAVQVRDALAHIDLGSLNLLFIEADGNAVNPAELDLGQHLRASVFSVAGGDDKATEFPFLVAGSDIVLLTKVDLLPFVSFDMRVFSGDISRLKSDLQLAEISVQSGQGMDRFGKWVEAQLLKRGNALA